MALSVVVIFHLNETETKAVGEEVRRVKRGVRVGGEGEPRGDR